MVKSTTRQALVIDTAAEGVERAILILSRGQGDPPLRSEEDLVRLAEALAQEYTPTPEKHPRRITPDNLIWLLLGGAAVGAAWVASGLL